MTSSSYCSVWRRGSGNPLWRSIKKVDGVRFSRTFGRADQVNAMTANSEARKWQEKAVTGMRWYKSWRSRQPKDVAELPVLGGSGDGLFSFCASHGKRLDFAAHPVFDAFMDELRERQRNKESRHIERSHSIFRFIASRLPEELPTTDLGWEELFLRIKSEILVSKNANGTPCSAHTRNHQSAVLRKFALHLWRKRIIGGEIRVMKEISQREPISTESKRVIPMEDLAALWNGAFADFRCYMLLGLNCGYYAVDIQTLEKTMVDLENGRAFGKRGKTGVPYNFRLWPTTLYWMKKRLEVKAVNNEGKGANEELLLFKSRFNGRITTIDTMFQGVQKRVWGEVRYSFSNFRDTGATVFELNIDPALTSYYLRHRQKAMKKFYTASGISPILDAAFDRLGNEFAGIFDYSEPPVRHYSDVIQRFNATRQGEISKRKFPLNKETEMKLMTKEVAKSLPAIKSQEEKGLNAVVQVKYFLESFTWYASEYDPEERLFFGFVTSCHCPEGELGYFSLDELASVRGRFGPVERDLYWEKKTLAEVMAEARGHSRSPMAEVRK